MGHGVPACSDTLLFGVLQAIDLSSDWVEGLYLVMVRAEGQAPKAARMVVKR